MELAKLEAQKQWNSTPCGTGEYLSSVQVNTLEYFETIRQSRYNVTDKWMKETIDFTCANGKKLLEIGHGIGSDLLTFRENGAEVYGVDITQKHHDMAKLNFELHNQPVELKLCDASNLGYPSEYFDVVYSNGVMHHTPDTIRCIGEAYRVLKPGGKIILSLYHKHSAFHYWKKIFVDGYLHGGIKRIGYDGVMATLEHGADGVNIKPLVKTYSEKELRIMLADFRSVDIKVRHLDKATQLPYIHRFIPKWLERALDDRFGWYIIAVATK